MFRIAYIFNQYYERMRVSAFDRVKNSRPLLRSLLHPTVFSVPLQRYGIRPQQQQQHDIRHDQRPAARGIAPASDKLKQEGRGVDCIAGLDVKPGGGGRRRDSCPSYTHTAIVVFFSWFLIYVVFPQTHVLEPGLCQRETQQLVVHRSVHHSPTRTN